MQTASVPAGNDEYIFQINSEILRMNRMNGFTIDVPLLREESSLKDPIRGLFVYR